MKKISLIVFVIFMLVIVIPTLLLISYDSPKEENDIQQKIINTQKIKVYFKDRELVADISINEYIKGVVAAEMPASFETEALKAQAIAARTYMLHKILLNDDKQKQAHKGGDICTDYTHCQAWKSKSDLKKMWGFIEYMKNWDKISQAVESTNNMVLVYNDQLIDPLFHSTSGGKTENSEDVFTANLPYLRSVTSVGEEVSPKYKDKVVMSFEQFKTKLDVIAKGIIILKNDINNIEIIEKSEGERIKRIKIGNRIFSGKEIRSALMLNSTNFEITLENNNVIINTIGYGHGVGMSQFGANYLAKSGKKYDAILKHYYNGVDIIKIKDLKK